MIRPRGPRALVQRIEAPKPSSSSIIIPETVQQKASQFALVIAIGTLAQGGFQAGDLVVLKDYCGCPVYVKLEGEEGPESECALVGEDDVLAVVEVE